jgi:hypothetical protein
VFPRSFSIHVRQYRSSPRIRQLERSGMRQQRAGSDQKIRQLHVARSRNSVHKGFYFDLESISNTEFDSAGHMMGMRMWWGGYPSSTNPSCLIYPLSNQCPPLCPRKIVFVLLLSRTLGKGYQSRVKKNNLNRKGHSYLATPVVKNPPLHRPLDPPWATMAKQLQWETLAVSAAL